MLPDRTDELNVGPEWAENVQGHLCELEAILFPRWEILLSLDNSLIDGVIIRHCVRHFCGRGKADGSGKHEWSNTY